MAIDAPVKALSDQRDASYVMHVTMSCLNVLDAKVVCMVAIACVCLNHF